MDSNWNIFVRAAVGFCSFVVAHFSANLCALFGLLLQSD